MHVHRNEISALLRWVTNGFHLVSVFLFGGIIFGWAPLKLILLAEGQYSERCADGNMNVTDSNNGEDDSSIACAEQMICFNAIFTVGQFLLNFVAVPVGFLLDMTSKPIYFTVAGMCQITGLVLFGISDSKPSSSLSSMKFLYHHDYFVISYGLMALGGCMAIIGAFPASFLVRPRRYQALILAACSCLFDSSSVIFYLLYKFNLSFPNMVSRKRAFLGLAMVALLVYSILVICWILLEKNDWRRVCDDEDNKDVGEINGNNDHREYDGSGDNVNHSVKLDDHEHNRKRSKYPQNAVTTSNSILHSRRIRRQRLHKLGVPQQLASFDFAVIAIYSSVHVLQCNLYIETVNEYLTSIGDHDAKYANMFSFILPCGIFFIPLIDRTIQNIGVVNTLIATNFLSLLFGSILLIPNLTVQTINFGIFTCFRAYLYSTLNTFIAKTFGASTTGRILGFTFTIGSVISLLQYPAASIAEGYLGNKFGAVNLILLVLCFLPVGVINSYTSNQLWVERYDMHGEDGNVSEDTGELLPLMD